MKIEPIEDFETSAIRTKTPGNYPKEIILHIEHGESLKSRMINILLKSALRFFESLHNSFRLDSVFFFFSTKQRGGIVPKNTAKTLPLASMF